MAKRTFAAQIKGFADLTKKNLEYVAVNAVQDVMEAAQTPQPGFGQGATTFEVGKIPVDTSAMINSLVSGADGAFGAPGAASYSVVLAGYELGDVMQFAWTAPYAIHVELGTSKMPGRHFVGANAARFSDFVQDRVAEVRK